MVALKCERKHRLVHGKRLLRTHKIIDLYWIKKKKTSADNKINCPFSTGKFQDSKYKSNNIQRSKNIKVRPQTFQKILAKKRGVQNSNSFMVARKNAFGPST